MAFNFRNWKKEPELTGVLAGQYKGVGKFKANVYVFRTRQEGKTVTVHSWASVGLNTCLTGVPFGTLVKLVFTGYLPMPDSDRQFMNFEIEVINSGEWPESGDKVEAAEEILDEKFFEK